jgi:hypothetical protein
MALPAPDREPREKPPLWVIQEAFEGDEPAEQPQDVYILHLLRALPPDLGQLLAPDQYQRLKQSLYGLPPSPPARCARGDSIPWTRYYFVFLFGEDTRAASRTVDFEHRAPERRAWVAGWLVMLAILGLLALGFLGVARRSGQRRRSPMRPVRELNLHSR